MRFRTLPLGLIIVLLFAWVGLAWPGEVSVVDDTGNTVTLPGPARRVISLAPDLTEILFHLGGGHLLVGAVEHSDFPEAAQQVPRIGSHNRFDFETILRLQPDLVLAWASGNPAELVKRLEQLGLTVYRAEPITLDELATTLARVGTLVGRAQVSATLASAFRSEAAAIQQHYQQRPVLSVFYQVWHQPLITLNGKHLVSRLLVHCGASNVFSDLPDIAPVVSRESVIARNPQIIIAGGTTAGAPAWLDDWQTWDKIDAVAAGHLFSVNADLLHRHSPRVLEGMRELCEIIDRARSGG